MREPQIVSIEVHNMQGRQMFMIRARGEPGGSMWDGERNITAEGLADLIEQLRNLASGSK